MTNALLCEVQITGCLSADLFYIEVPDQGSDDANVAAANNRYAELFGGPFRSHYCDQCHDSTSMCVEVLSTKRSRKVRSRAAIGRHDANGQEYVIHRLRN